MTIEREEYLSTDLVLLACWYDFAKNIQMFGRHRVANIACKLRELPNENNSKPSKIWNEIGEEGRNAWRDEISNAIKGKQDLIHGLIEFGSRWLPNSAFSEPVHKNVESLESLMIQCL